MLKRRSMPLSPATRLGPYEILSSIGAGGMGEVYRARDTRLERTVAIKVLPEHLSSNPQLRFTASGEGVRGLAAGAAPTNAMIRCRIAIALGCSAP